MKKLIMIAAVAAISTGAYAQASFGIQVGANSGRLQIESTSGGTTTEENTESTWGFLFGAVAEVPISETFVFRPELNFIQKGGKLDQNSSQGGVTSVSKGEQTINFIEIPMNFVYMAPAGMGTFFIGAGPSIGFGISGDYEFTNTTTFPGIPTVTSTGKGDVNFDGKKDSEVPANDTDVHLKRIDFGANALAGYKLSNGLFLNVGYAYGFSNLNPNDNESLKTRGFNIKLGYMFGGNKSKSSDQ
jgi:hypothetical protein